MDFRGFLYVVCAAFMWGSTGIFAKELLAEGIAPLEIAFWRAMLGWVLFAVHAFLRKQVSVRRNDLPVICGFGIICITLFYGSYQIAIRDIGMAMAAVLLYTAPAWVALMSWLLLKEEMTPVKMLSVLITIIGVGCICLGPTIVSATTMPLNTFGLSMGLISGFTYALYYIFGKKFFHKYPTPTIFLYALPIGSAMLFPFIEFEHKTPYAWGLLVGLAVVTAYGAFSAYYAGLKRLEATYASVIATFEPVVAAVFAYLLFDEHFSLSGYAGSCLIIAAVFLVVMSGSKTSHTAGVEV